MKAFMASLSHARLVRLPFGGYDSGEPPNSYWCLGGPLPFCLPRISGFRTQASPAHRAV